MREGKRERRVSLVLLLTLIGICAVSIPGYLTAANIQQLATDYAEPTLVALAMFIVVLSGGIDLSVGAVFALADLAALILFRVDGWPVGTTIAIVLMFGAAIGAVNGLLVAVIGLGPFMTTLATLLVLRGVYDLVSQAFTLQLADAANDGAAWQLIGGNLFGFPTNLLGVGIIGTALHLIVTRTRIGMHVSAVGSHAEAARHAGVPIVHTRFWVYPTASSIVAFAGVLYAARQDSAGSNVGSGWEVAALTAVVLGGIRLSGGTGSVADVLIGSGSMFVLSSGLLRLNVPGSASSAVTGGALLLAVAARVWFARHPQVARAPEKHHAKEPTAVPDTREAAPGSPNEMIGEAIVRLAGATKIYGGIRALDDVDICFERGAVHALVGQNGAGKSTLAEIVAGATGLSAGGLEIDGVPRGFASPADAAAAGIAMVYQESSLVPDMTVAQNLVLGRERFFVDQAAYEREARVALAEWDSKIAVDERADRLSTAAQQMVEIARAIRRDARVFVFDEPTAALTPHERQTFFGIVARLKRQGAAVVFITHALEEALAQADTISVLRDGKLVKTSAAGECTRLDLIDMMIGRVPANASVAGGVPAVAAPSAVPALECLNVADGRILKGMSLLVRRHEVVGLTGLVGSGRTELGRLAVGLDNRAGKQEGCIKLHGTPVAIVSPRKALRVGLVYVTEDRKREGMFDTLSATDNVVLGILARPASRGFLYPGRRNRVRMARPVLEQLALDDTKAAQPLASLSGGNQQRVVIARAFAQDPTILILDEPTRGVDVGAIPSIHAAIRACAGDGMAVLAISSDLREILALSDRIVVAKAGAVAARFDMPPFSEEAIVSAAIG